MANRNPFDGSLTSPPPGLAHSYDAPLPETPPVDDHGYYPSRAVSPPPNNNPAQGMGLPAGAAAPGERTALVGQDDIAAADPLLGADLHSRRPFYGARESSYTIGSMETLGRDSINSPVFNEKYASGAALNEYNKGTPRSTLRNTATGYPLRPKPQTHKKRWMVLGCIALIALIIAIAIPVGVVVSRKNTDSNSQKSSSGVFGNSPSPSGPAAGDSGTTPTAPQNNFIFRGAASGGDGSTVTALNGTTFVYRNSFGGTWSAQPGDFSARAQDDVPPLSQSWDYTMFIRGVNLGGWLNTEPFICTDLYERFLRSTPQAVDEWTLSQNLDAVGPNEKERVFEDHYSTFITEEDFAHIAGAGLNWVRLPVPFWMLETYPGEPYYTGQWKHFLNALEWARKYGLRINLDLHGMPGSQNGWDHSGRRTFHINFLQGPMGFANAQRGLNYIRILTQFISQPQYSPMVPMFGILNEPQLAPVSGGSTQPVGFGYYTEAYKMIRNITGIGKGPMIIFHDGFLGTDPFGTFLPGADRIGYDAHPYFAFDTQTNGPFAENINKACARANIFRAAMGTFGVATGGEWSLAVNDCSQFLNGVGLGLRYEGTYPTGQQGAGTRVGSCDQWNNYETWSDDLKANFRNLALAWMDATQNSFFWTWKVRKNQAGNYPNPVWSYQLGLWNGWMPADPRNYSGTCQAIGGGPAPWSGTFDAAQTGGPGAGNVAAADLARYPWPPVSMISTDPNLVFTATGSVFTLPVATPTIFPVGATQTSIDPGDGWANTADTQPLYTPISGMAYSDAWGVAGEDILKRSQPTPAPQHRRRAEPIR